MRPNGPRQASNVRLGWAPCEATAATGRPIRTNASYACGVNPAAPARRALLALPIVALALVLAGCSGSSTTDCGLDGCTIAFPRSGEAAVSVLGIEAKLVGVQNDVADIEVAGQRVRVPVGAETRAAGFTVGVERLTSSEVVVRVRP